MTTPNPEFTSTAHRRIRLLPMGTALCGLWLLTTSGVASALDPSLPLLDTNPNRSPLAKACANLPDDAPLPTDPRQLVVPGVNTPGAAVQFNAYWQDVHKPAPPWKLNPLQRAQTCGQWKEWAQLGRKGIQEGSFVVTHGDGWMYHNLWRVWDTGFLRLPILTRPVDFDDQVIKRYGLTKATFRNPYPLPGEDPSLTNGGSGQLPSGMAQERAPDGRYTGKIGITCELCHASSLGKPTDGPGLGTVPARGNDAVDWTVMSSDFARVWDLHPSGVLPIAETIVPVPLFGQSKGRTQASLALEVVNVYRDIWNLNFLGAINLFPLHASAGDVRAPNWWNLGHRPREFYDAGFTSDNARSHILLLAGDPTKVFGDELKAKELESEYSQAYFESVSPPPYPRPVNIPLAEEGAVLFHSRDLWAGSGLPDVPREPGNGSCASCHGAYSPRYAADPNYLSDPRLIGIAATLTPVNNIGTDPNRANWMSPGGAGMRDAWDKSWWAYSDLSPDWSYLNRYTPGASPWIRETGYQAQPLYGVWASTPYFHNGSVPTLRGVLDSSEADRPLVWRRKLTAAGSNGINRGFDSSLEAYDFVKLGWKHDVINCDGSISDNGRTNGVFGTTPTLVACQPGVGPFERLLADLGLIGGQLSWIANWDLPPLNDQAVQSRYTFNTLVFSHGNQGHKYGDGLSEHERTAIIEYLKTL